jgi:hypothetical protein
MTSLAMRPGMAPRTPTHACSAPGTHRTSLSVMIHWLSGKITMMASSPRTQIDRTAGNGAMEPFLGAAPTWVIAAQLWRQSLLAQGGETVLACTLRTLQPISLIALLATLVLLFGFQGEQIVRQPIIIALLAVPIIIQVYLNAGIAYGLNRALGVPYNVACPSALIGASNFFELAVAAAIALFGFQSALATVVGVLVEVPLMLSVVRIVLRTRGWYEHARTV